MRMLDGQMVPFLFIALSFHFNNHPIRSYRSHRSCMTQSTGLKLRPKCSTAIQLTVNCYHEWHNQISRHGKIARNALSNWLRHHLDQIHLREINLIKLNLRWKCLKFDFSVWLNVRGKDHQIFSNTLFSILPTLNLWLELYNSLSSKTPLISFFLKCILHSFLLNSISFMYCVPHSQQIEN